MLIYLISKCFHTVLYMQPYLRRNVRAGIFALVQLVPSLHEFNNHGIAEVHQLKACHIGSPMHETLQINVLKALPEQRRGKSKKYRERERGWGGGGLLKCSWKCSATIREIPQTFISRSPLLTNSVHSQRAARERACSAACSIIKTLSPPLTLEYKLVSQIDVSCLKKNED